MMEGTPRFIGDKAGSLLHPSACHYDSMGFFILPLAATLLYLIYRIIQWRLRLARVRRSLPAIGLVISPFHMLRRLYPSKYQRWSPHWQFQRAKHYDNLGTDIVPTISLFGDDIYYVADADAVVELATNVARFPKNLKLYGILSPSP